MEKTFNSAAGEFAQDLIIELSGKNQELTKRVINNVFSFVGLAGGVGTSTLVANLAHALGRKGFSTVVIDLNICCPSQHLYFHSEQKVKKPDLVSLLAGENKLGVSIEKRESNVYLLYANNRILFDRVSMDTSGASSNLGKVIEQLSSLFDVVLLDVPALGELDYELTNTALYKSDYIMAVMDENVKCVGAYNRFIKNLSYVGINTQNTVKVLMNKRTNIAYPSNVFKSLGIELVTILPYEISIVEAGLRAMIYIDKGASNATTAAQFVEGIEELRFKLLAFGGFIDEKERKIQEKREEKEVIKQQDIEKYITDKPEDTESDDESEDEADFVGGEEVTETEDDTETASAVNEEKPKKKGLFGRKK